MHQPGKINYIELPCRDLATTKAFFSFPGGRRFHFIEPGGNEYAVWSE